MIDGTCSTHEINKIFVDNFSLTIIKNRGLRKPGHRNQRNVAGGCWLDWSGSGLGLVTVSLIRWVSVRDFQGLSSLEYGDTSSVRNMWTHYLTKTHLVRYFMKYFRTALFFTIGSLLWKRQMLGVPCLWWLVAGFSPQRRAYDPRAVRVCFTGGESGTGTGFSPSGVTFGFPLLSAH